MSNAMIINPGSKNCLGEGPLWLAHNNQLLWVDVEAGKLWCHDAQTARNFFRTLPKRPTSLARSKNGLVIVFRRQIGFLKTFNGTVELLDISRHLEGRERLNDCTVDHEGQLWVGSMDVEQTAPIGRIFCLSRDMGFTPVIENLIVANGLEWSVDRHTLFAVDSGTREVRALGWTGASRSAEKDHTVFVYPAGETPDGMAMDAEGNLWVAVVGAGRIDKIKPSGEILERIVLPLPNPTSCTIGGPDGASLYCTSMCFGTEDAAPGKVFVSGATLMIPIGTHGRPTRLFAGW